MLCPPGQNWVSLGCVPKGEAGWLAARSTTTSHRGRGACVGCTVPLHMVSPEPHSFRRKSHPHVTLHLRRYSTVTAERPELGIYALTSTCQAECISTLRHCQHLVPEQRRSWASPSGASGSGHGPQAPGNSVTPQEVEVLSDQRPQEQKGSSAKACGGCFSQLFFSAVTKRPEKNNGGGGGVYLGAHGFRGLSPWTAGSISQGSRWTQHLYFYVVLRIEPRASRMVDANANRTKGMRPAQVWWDLSWRLLGPEGPETFPACTIPPMVLTRGLNFTTLRRAAACSCT
ncbi:uncharacterized protein LOC124095888 isoform X2 [Marmota monax]|uniref:uncharacterized protein LOC124095888 isoform X2 n=1 Tax=Marmota monax TaxID=9995 RepID=UPI0026ECA751|nr:uncharacterized protein LOC124095888 isoform X2 [Marmota monax]